MFKVVEYRTKWLKKPGAPENIAVPTKKKVVREFPTLEDARRFAEGKTKTAIEYPRKFIKEMNA